MEKKVTTENGKKIWKMFRVYLERGKRNDEELYEETITEHKMRIWINRIDFRNISKNGRFTI